MTENDLQDHNANGRALTEDQTINLETIESIQMDIRGIIKRLKELTPLKSGREKSLAITNLQQANHWLDDAHGLDYQHI